VNTVRFWHLKLKLVKGLPVSNHLLESTRTLACLPADLMQVIEHSSIHRQLQEAIANLKVDQKNHRELRDAYLSDLAEALVLNRHPGLAHASQEAKLNKKKAHQIRALRKREHHRRMHIKINLYLSDSTDNRNGLSIIDVPAGDIISPFPAGPDPKTWEGPWTSITDPAQIAQYVCTENSRQYSQALYTPFGSGYLADQIGLNASTQAAEDLLKGSFTPDVTQVILPETLEILDELGKPLSLQERVTHARISVEEFKQTYKIVKESTSSSPSGRHVGHYKAVTKDDLLSEILSTMMSLPYQVGFSPIRWRNVIDVMLEKKPGEPKVHRLRIIALLESDYNQANRILFARRLGFRLKDDGLVSPMQYGSRPGKLCVSAVLNKQLAFDITRYSKQTAAFIKNDAIGCYDRLINPLLLLQLRRLGAPATSAASLHNTWSRTNHRIKTLYGVSDQMYIYSSTTPLFGPGQGSTISPFLWLLLFCLITDALDSTPGMEFTSIDGTMNLSSQGEAFVDDSFLGVTSPYLDSNDLSFVENQTCHKNETIQNLNTLSKKWEWLLFTTGGAINLKKSHWILMSWKWSNGTASLEAPVATSPQLLLTAGYDVENPVPVPQLSPYDSYKTLGVILSPSGSNTQSYRTLHAKGTEYASHITGSSLSREEAWCSYILHFLPAVNFSLPVSNFTETQCEKIQSPAVMAVLPKLHFNRHTARSIVFGPVVMGGIGLPHTYANQSISQLQLFIGHIRSADKTDKYIRITMSHLQLLTGSDTAVLQLSYPKYDKWIDHSWLTSIWKLCHRSKITITVKHHWTPALLHTNDVMLMDYFIMNKYKPKELALLNKCRVYLKVISLADITSADGEQIMPSYKLGLLSQDRKSTLNWPTQQRPGRESWKLWQNALQLLETGSRLTHPLANWVASPHQSWFYYMDTSSLTLYYKDVTNEWRSITPSTKNGRTRSSGRNHYDVANLSACDAPTTVLAPATVTKDPASGLYHATSSSYTLPAHSSPIITSETLSHYLLREPFYHRLLGPVDDIESPCYAIAEALLSGTLHICTDGSYDPISKRGSHGWVFSDTLSDVWKRAGPVDGHQDLMSPYRAELSGILAGLHILHAVCLTFGISGVTVNFYCDCEKAIKS
jgi:hypothetical protein